MRTEPLRVLIAHGAPPPEALLESLSSSESVGSVHLARGLEEAVAYLREGKPPSSLVILDLQLPGNGALELARRMKERPELRKIPIIALTPSRESFAFRSLRDLGVTSSLSEPIDTDQVSCVLAEVASYWRVMEDRPGDV